MTGRMKIVTDDKPRIVCFSLTQQEIEMVEYMREWTLQDWDDPDPELEFTATFKNGCWECCLTNSLHPSRKQEFPPGAVFVSRGVGTSFVEAFCNLAGCNDEALDDDSEAA